RGGERVARAYGVGHGDAVAGYFEILPAEQQGAPFAATRHADCLPAEPRGIAPAEGFEAGLGSPEHLACHAHFHVVELDHVGQLAEARYQFGSVGIAAEVDVVETARVGKA